MTSVASIPETKVLAIASHVSYGYVGNTMATFVMQTLGCEVAAINTVNFSNHTGYRQVKGRKTPAEEVEELYAGLKQSYLTDFDVLLSGYAPSAAVVRVVGTIARDLRYRSAGRPGSFFWILDPVMGDQGRLYVAEDIVPEYRSLIREADLILPNQFEAETLSGCKIESLSGVKNAIRTLHKQYSVPHILVTSVRFAGESNGSLSVVGSSMKGDGEARLWRIEVPMLDCFFSGTGDMFAALMVPRLREESARMNLLEKKSWMSDDDVEAQDLPLARAAEKVLSSMQMVLEKTMKARNEEMEKWGKGPGASLAGVDAEGSGGDGESKRRYLAQTKAAEVRVVRNAKDLMQPEERYRAQAIDMA